MKNDSTPSEGWAERFDEEFYCSCVTGQCDHCSSLPRVKDFISKLLLSKVTESYDMGRREGYKSGVMVSGEYVKAEVDKKVKNKLKLATAKARQEVYDEMECGWDICLTNAQYERCVEAQVKKAKQEARQEIIKEIFEKVVLSEDQARVIRELEED